MQIVGILVWWYSRGWVEAARRVGVRIEGLMDYFSIDLLVKTLFSPFRQISAGSVDGPVGLKLRAFFDKLISRIIGGIVRTIVLVIGLVTIILGLVIGVVYLALWAVIPLLPIAGLVLMLTGWVPWTII